MNKTELATYLSQTQNLSKSAAQSIVDAIFDSESGVIASELRAGNKVSIHGFGTFQAADRKARTAKNPKTGETVQVPARKAPKFSAGKGLKDSLTA
jgi:DNA-binding protein HU-beta